MESDAAILKLISEAFAGCPKPEHFTDYTHCEECRDHDDVLRSRDVTSLAIEDVGNCGWDPLCYTSAEGFAYLLPALARLVLSAPTERFGWYGPQLLFHLAHDGHCSRFLPQFGRDQTRAVVALLKHIGATRQSLVSDYIQVDELQFAIDVWSRTDPA